MTKARAVLLAILTMSVIGCSVLYAHAQASSVSEYRVKAAFVYNFAKFVDWPAVAFANHQAPLILCIVGTDPFGAALEILKDKTIKHRKLVVQHKSQRETLNDCQIIFISASEHRLLGQLLGPLQDKLILTVSDMDGFLEVGGMINLMTVANKIRFEVNLDAVRRAGLTISAQLLKLATAVKGMP
jgi:hypothetical protein